MKICNTCRHPWDQHEVLSQSDLNGKIGCRVSKCQCQYTEEMGYAKQEPIEGTSLLSAVDDDL